MRFNFILNRKITKKKIIVICIHFKFHANRLKLPEKLTFRKIYSEKI